MPINEMFDIDNEVFRRQINKLRVRICDRHVDVNAGWQIDLTNTPNGCLRSGMTEILCIRTRNFTHIHSEHQDESDNHTVF